jgi:hypothetical protein
LLKNVAERSEDFRSPDERCLGIDDDTSLSCPHMTRRTVREGLEILERCF